MPTNDFLTISFYGSDHTGNQGVLSDHVHLVDPSRIRTLANGRRVAVDWDGKTYPIVCSEVVMVSTEDGPMDGRCGQVVRDGGFACPGHAEQIESWRRESAQDMVGA